MKKLLSVTLLLFIATLCRAQHLTLNQGGAKPGYYEELPYEDINGKLFLNVEMNGAKHRFLFDTGAPCMVSEALAAELKAPEIASDTAADVNHTKAATTVIKVDITLGKTLFSGVPALKGWPQGGLLSCWPIDGVIGSNILRNSIAQIDAKRHLIIITDQKNKLNLKSANSTKLITNVPHQSSPIVQLFVGDKVNMLIEFDSGDNGLLRLNKDLTDQVQKYGVFEILAKGYGADTYGMSGVQKADEKYRIKFPKISIGKAVIANAITETNKDVIPGIGTAFLKYGNITLDYMHGKFYFDPDSAVTNLDAKQWPLNPGVADGKLIVGVVWDKFTDKLIPGEQIVAINEVDYSHVDLCELMSKAPALTGRVTSVLTIKDKNGNLRKVRIDKE